MNWWEYHAWLAELHWHAWHREYTWIDEVLDAFISFGVSVAEACDRLAAAFAN